MFAKPSLLSASSSCVSLHRGSCRKGMKGIDIHVFVLSGHGKKSQCRPIQYQDIFFSLIPYRAKGLSFLGKMTIKNKRKMKYWFHGRKSIIIIPSIAQPRVSCDIEPSSCHNIHPNARKTKISMTKSFTMIHSHSMARTVTMADA